MLSARSQVGLAFYRLLIFCQTTPCRCSYYCKHWRMFRSNFCELPWLLLFRRQVFTHTQHTRICLRWGETDSLGRDLPHRCVSDSLHRCYRSSVRELGDRMAICWSRRTILSHGNLKGVGYCLRDHDWDVLSSRAHSNRGRLRRPAYAWGLSLFVVRLWKVLHISFSTSLGNDLLGNLLS